LKSLHFELSDITNGQKFKKLLSLNKAQENLWRIYAPLAVKLLKDSHTNFQKYIGIGITYFGKFTPLYAKNDAASNTN
jgi:hypothetical protein